MTLDQQEVVEAVETLSKEVRNQDYSSEADVKRYLTEIKRVHTIYKKAFNEPAFAWQVDYYTIQMALENEYKFVFVHDQRMTWTFCRWKFALTNALAILHYHHSVSGIMINLFGFNLMCMWLFFQYFNVSVFNGHHFEEIFNESIKIANESDQAILQCLMDIKQWRMDNDAVIRTLNSQKTKWRQEKARIDRLLNGKMKQKEVEMYHIFHWSDPRWTFDVNVRSASLNLGISINGIKKIIRECGIAESDFWGYLTVHKEEEADAKYEKEVKWAEKVRSNLLTKKERKEFWRKFSIPNPQLLFRTFTVAEEDLIPASNPLLTTEDGVDSKCMNPWMENPRLLSIPSRMDMMFKDGVPQIMSGFTPMIEGLFGID